MLRVRPLSVADREAILAIQQASPEAAQWSAEAWLPIFTSVALAARGESWRTGFVGWVAEAEGKIVGFLVGLQLTGEMEILNLAVSLPARRAGVASQLLACAIEQAQRIGAQRLYLEVRASNTGAAAFYKRHGFVGVDRRPNYYADPPEDAMVMARSL